MYRFRLASLGLALAGGVLLAADPQKPDLSKLPPAASRSVDFVKDIEPILKSRCVSCHGERKERGGLRLDAGELAMRGGNSGPAIVPGKSEASRLVHVVAGVDPEFTMPEGGKPLTRDEVALLRAWIDQGANWPRSDKPVAVATRSDHWAYQPIIRPPLPKVRNEAWARHEMDIFLLARLEKEGIAPSPEADRVTLIRRLSFDLLGLPPSPEEVDTFVSDHRPDAYERLVDRLLASPHYGERWARHWLDLARYADSDGYEKDTGRPHAWRYRHWVIEALNRNMPFDQFTIEQLAGDLLPNASTEQKVATGFHRNTLTNREGGVDKEQFRVEAVVDRVNTTAKVFLGTTMGCAQCHDHKYDPFSQRDYYQLFAYFNSDEEVDIAAPVPEIEAKLKPLREAHAKKLAELQAAVKKHQATLPLTQERWERGLGFSSLLKLPPVVLSSLMEPPAKRTAKQKKELADYFAKQDAELTRLQRAVTDHQRAAPLNTMAQTLALGTRRPTHVMVRGDFLRPGAAVVANTPAVLPRLPHAGSTPTRLDLARWIVDPSNPLTARVTVNWVWQRYFGRGIVATLDDFGTQGERPTHPELLDWLASEFVRRGWDLKELHKLIVTSATYRQSSRARPELADRDPANTLLARQNRLRLDAEIIRDNALAVSGLLTREIGGPSVRPPQPAGISELTYANSARWVESKGPDRYRRGMYIWFQRTSPYPTLMMFDAPDSNVCAIKRERSNTPLQALTLMNDVVFVEAAQAFASRIVKEAATTEARVDHAFRLAVARPPTEREKARLLRFLDDLREEMTDAASAKKLVGEKGPKGMDAAEAAAWVAFARALLNLDEFVTRE